MAADDVLGEAFDGGGVAGGDADAGVDGEAGVLPASHLLDGFGGDAAFGKEECESYRQAPRPPCENKLICNFFLTEASAYAKATADRQREHRGYFFDRIYRIYRIVLF